MISTPLLIFASAVIAGYLIFELVELPWYFFSYDFFQPLPLTHRLIATVAGSIIFAVSTGMPDPAFTGLAMIGFIVGTIANTVSPLRDVAGRKQ